MPHGTSQRVLQAALVLLAFVCAVAAEPPPPAIDIPPSPGRNYTVLGQALLIRPGGQSTYLLFSDGVTVKGTDFLLSAATVELDIESSELTGGKAFKLPKAAGGSERVVQDPGKVASELARDLKLPQAHFSTSSLKRVGAAGGVKVSAKGISLTTSGLVSRDGGRSWATVGRCEITRVDPVSGDTYKLSANDVVYDTKTQRALAKGKVLGRFELRDREPIAVEAEHCELDLGQGTLSVSGSLQVKQGTLELCCGALTANLKTQTLKASDTPHLEESLYGITLDAAEIDVNIKTQSVSATGQVEVHEAKRGVSLRAGRVDADLKAKAYVATLKPVVNYGGSTFSGEKITVRQDGGKTVVEVEGEQRATIDLDEVQEKGPAEAGP